MRLSSDKKPYLASLLCLGILIVFMALTSYFVPKTSKKSKTESQLHEWEITTDTIFFEDSLDEELFAIAKVQLSRFLMLTFLVLSTFQVMIVLQKLHFLFLDIPPPFLP